MKLRVTNIKQPVSEGDERLIDRVAGMLGVEAQLLSAVRIVRRALDARKKQDIHFLITVVADLEDAAAKRLLMRGDMHITIDAAAPPQTLTEGSEQPRGRVVVAGLGPAGLFAALLLAQRGYAPLVLERGDPVETRAERVQG
jgi:uncharacterized FAD-dependent dehydrogenase